MQFKPHRGSRAFHALSLWLSLPLSHFASGAELPDGLRPFLEKHCYECHDADSKKGDLNLQGLSSDLADGNRVRLWTAVHDRLLHGEMPPKDADQPTAGDSEQNRQLLAGFLTEADRARREVVLRRLNRVEYENTVRDLFSIDVFVREMLPEDASSHGFDNIGASLSVSTEQMQAYLETADAVLNVVFGSAGNPKRIATKLNLRDIIKENDGEKSVRITKDGVVLFNSGYNPSVLSKFDNPGPGLYRVRIQAKAVQTDKPVTMLVYAGVWGLRDKYIAGFFDVPPGEVSTIEFTDRLWEPSDTFEIYPFDTIHRQTDPDHYTGPGLFLGDVKIEGPLGEWPPASRARILGAANAVSGKLEDAERILGAFLPRAFRRPTGAEDLNPILALVRQALEAGKPFEKALRLGLKAALCSPAFLYLEEPGEGKVSDHALATRLSYLLWNSMPDADLLALAGKGSLRDAKVLRQEVERMLKDGKAKRFTDNFTGQWLKLREIDSTLPDEKLYPDYDELLKRSMVEESQRFFQEILDADLSVANFIQSDFIYINERLARHYGIPGVTGQVLRRVSLPPDSVRGGVLTQASVLKVTANGTATSPVTRGAWLLNNILGQPSPPPPAGTPAVEPDIRGATTIRQQLDKHRNVESCARCHRRIDPPGFALESFDVIGGWRDF